MHVAFLTKNCTNYSISMIYGEKDSNTILIVDDEIDIREILKFNLEYEGFQVDLAPSAEEALEILSSEHKLVLLDVMMGGMSGFKMADQLRKSGNTIPIIFLTAKDTENDMLTGFSIGGDDYISKPFSVKEVIARVKTLLKRVHIQSQQSTPNNRILQCNEIKIDEDSKTVFINEEPVDLTKTEFDMLYLLVKNEGKVFSREDILNKVWKEQGAIVVDRTVDVHITRLRKKLGECGKYIINRSGYGYLFKAIEK